MSTRFPKLLVAAAMALVVTAAVVGVGVLIRNRDQPSRLPVSALATPLSAVDTTTMVVRRDPFCGNVSGAAATAALGGPVQSVTAYAPGQKAQLGSTEDVADEHGCRWVGAQKGTGAAAWVFAPPVTRDWARQLAATRPSGCQPVAAPAYGRPTSAYSCNGAVTLTGLFGDAWLSCRLNTTDVERAGRWCLAVARAAAD